MFTKTQIDAAIGAHVAAKLVRTVLENADADEQTIAMAIEAENNLHAICDYMKDRRVSK